MMTDDDGSAFDAAMDLIQEDRPQEALVEAARETDPTLRPYAEALAYLDLAMAEAARGAHARLVEAAGAESPEALRIEAEIALATWEIGRAQLALERLCEVDPEDAFGPSTLAIVADVQGDDERARALQARAHALDPDHMPAPFHIDDAAFDAVVEETLANLPEKFRRAIANVRIVREPTPYFELAEAALFETPPDILGLFVGPTIHDGELSGEHPATIYLFRRNLERMVEDEEELSEEIRVTLLHEIGHALGLDEDEVAELGLA